MRLPFFLLCAVAWAQDPTVEKAHEPLYKSIEDKRKAVSSLTAATATGQGSREKLARRSFIDEHVFGRMQKDRIPHAGLASDEEFARRAWLDAAGRIPEPDELRHYLAAADREKLIDKLVDSPAFVDKWTYYFEDLFRAGGRMGSGLNLFHFWVKEWLRLDRPYNEVATELLTGGGKTSYSIPGGLYFARDFVKAKDDPEEDGALDLNNMQDVVDEFTVTYSKVFLGLNLGCISCHDGRNHLEKVNRFLVTKKRRDFFAQAAFFGKTRQIMNWENGYQANTEYTVDDLAPGYDTKAVSILRIPRGKDGLIAPRFILTGETPRAGLNERDELARMITTHPQFAKALVNRIWAELMGFGLVEPMDDFDLGRADQASNPELLDALARDFQQSGFRLKPLVKRIMKSSAYQLSSRFEGEWKEEYAPYYARKFVRMLSAAELHDAILVATGGSKGMAQQMPEPKKASNEVQNFMRVFGQSNRDDMPKKTPVSTLEAMALMQSNVVNQKVLAMNGSRVEKLLNESPGNDGLLEALYLATLSRRPSKQEAETALGALAKDRRRGAENLQWALINSPEFLFNY